MFYSHEILTSRKHGVATIWLVATLGQRSSLKKVTRRAILDVDLEKACATISDAHVPLALRLQGSLLYGVSRVYSEKCTYVLHDADTLRDDMRRAALRLKANTDLDMPRSKTRAEHLNLAETPDFNIEDELMFDVSAFGLPTGDSDDHSLLSPPTLASSQSSALLDEDFVVPELELPSYDDPAIRSLNLDYVPYGDMSSGSKDGGYQLASGLDDAPPIFTEHFGSVADNGELVFDEPLAPGLEFDQSQDNWDGIVQSTRASFVVTQSQAADVGVTTTTRIGHGFGPATSPRISTTTGADPTSITRQEMARLRPTIEGLGEVESAIAAPQRRIRRVKPLEPDIHTQLLNSELTGWRKNYPRNMRVARQNMLKKVLLPQAKMNAAFLLEGQGIGEVEVNFGRDLVPHPLAAFSGQILMDALTGSKPLLAGLKRSHAAVDDGNDDPDQRRVRSRNANYQTGLDFDTTAVRPDEEEGPSFIGLQDAIIESEVGREAPSSLRHDSSQMPWNISSRAGSERRYGSAVFGGSSSAGLTGGFRPGSAKGTRPSRHRLTSASPLVGRGPAQSSRAGSIGILSDLAVDLTNFDMDSFSVEDDAHGLRIGSDFDTPFQLQQEGAEIGASDPLQVLNHESQSTQSTLEREAHNFLRFLTTHVESQTAAATAAGLQPVLRSTNFETLLPSSTNLKAVGAHAFMHVLALATKSLIAVNQGEGFGDIEIHLPEERFSVEIEG